MEAATIAVLVITGAFLALCGWIEWHSRRRSAGTKPMEEALVVTEQEAPPENFRRKRRLRR